MRKKTRFMLLTRHTDEELTEFLQKQAEAGWWLEANKGNRFTFVKRPYVGHRVCAYTFPSREPEIPTENQLRQELVLLRKQGWDMICISGPETLTDSRRHAFLAEEVLGSPLPKADAKEREKAAKRGKQKALANLALCLLYIAALSVVLLNDLARLVSNNGYLCFSIAFAGLLIASLALTLHSLRGKAGWLDVSTRLIFFMLVFAAVFLMVDGLWGDNGRTGVRTQIGETTVVLYHDAVPVALEDVGADVSGIWRSTRNVSSHSFLASYRHCFDESLGTRDERLSFISYTCFSVANPWMLKVVSRQNCGDNLTEDASFATRLGLDKICLSASHKNVLIQKGDTFVSIQSGFPLEERQIGVFLSALW